MPYAIMRFAKRKGGAIRSLEAHNERKKEYYKSNPDIQTDRSIENYHLVQPQQKYYAEIMSRIEKTGCKVRKDSVLMVDALITASPEFMASLPAENQKEYFERATEFIRKEVGEKNVFAATVHMDEKTPHMHLCFVPITSERKLSAKTVLGNQTRLSEWQTKFHEHMSARWEELERGASAMETQRKHIPVWLYKKAQKMDMEFDRVRQALNEINVLNAGRKREEAISTLAKWVPEAEKFTAQLRNVEGYVQELKRGTKAFEECIYRDNRMLQRRVDELDKSFIRAKQETFHLSEELRKQKRLLDSVPKEVMERIMKARNHERTR
jgi:hypothetical protein